MPHHTSSPQKPFTNIFRSGGDLNARLEAWSGVRGDHAETAGIAAHEAAERRAARKQEAAQSTAQARRWKAKAARAHWASEVPSSPQTVSLPLTVRAAYGVLIARAARRGGDWKARVAAIEIARRLHMDKRAAHRTLATLVERGLVSVRTHKAAGAQRHEINVYTLLDHAAIAAAAARQKPGDNFVTHLPNGRSNTTTKLQGAPSANAPGAGLQDEGEAAGSGQGGQPPQDVPEEDATALAERAAADLGIEGGDLAALARAALALYAPDLAPRAWAAGIELHGQRRAALAAALAARLVCLRDGTVDPIRSPAAYLAGILRKPPGQCRPERTLAGLDRGPAAGRIEARSQHQRERETVR